MFSQIELEHDAPIECSQLNEYLLFMSEKNFKTNSEQETAEIGRSIGEALEEGTVIGLSGTLGAGKTRLTQAIALALGITDGQVTSPTFTICVPHEGRLGLLHLDAYRIKDPSEVDELGLDELVEHGVVLIVEWVERIEKLLPQIDLHISIEPLESKERNFKFVAASAKGKALLEAVSHSVD